MTDYSEQIKRIKFKLIEAKKTDKSLKVFGASSHKYALNKPVSSVDIIAFENRYAIQLPNCYKAFISEIGNGGVSYGDSAAGPFYGIYPLGKNTDELLFENAEKKLKNDCIITPKMSNAHWNSLTETINSNENIPDDIYENELAKLYGGILPIGSQGCTYIHAIILNGKFKGRVVNLDLDRQLPQFAFETNFLDWYERWLDEVISGELLENKPSWFGYTKGGSEVELLEGLVNTTEEEDKIDCLDGLLTKQFVSISVIQQAEKLYSKTTGNLKSKLLQLISKAHYIKSKPYLIEHAKTDLLLVFQCIYWYGKYDCLNWLEFIEENKVYINDEETFRYCCYILQESNTDYADFVIPFTKHENTPIKTQAIYSLGLSKNKSDYIDTFIEGLNNDSPEVIHSALQALSNVKDKKLLESYKRIAERFTENDTYYVLSNLNLRLKDYGLDNLTIQNKTKSLTLNSDNKAIKKKWFEIWK